MPGRILKHLRSNVVAYIALFVALGGSSYAAVRLAPNSVTSRAIAKGAVTNAKIAKNAVTSTSIRNGTLGSSDFARGALLQGLKGDAGAAGARGDRGLAGIPGLKGETGAQGPTGPAGHDGSASIGLAARTGGATTAPKGAQTSIPLSGATWTQSAGELDLVTGSVTMTVPPSCTGSFGNSFVISVDGAPLTFAVAPTAPAGGTVTVPLNVGTLSEPAGDTAHTMTASLANTCTGSNESYSVQGAKLDVVKFR
jgi:Collagen triple helix repeat (20 copies)